MNKATNEELAEFVHALRNKFAEFRHAAAPTTADTLIRDFMHSLEPQEKVCVDVELKTFSVVTDAGHIYFKPRYIVSGVDHHRHTNNDFVGNFGDGDIYAVFKQLKHSGGQDTILALTCVRDDLISTTIHTSSDNTSYLIALAGGKELSVIAKHVVRAFILKSGESF